MRPRLRGQSFEGSNGETFWDEALKNSLKLLEFTFLQKGRERKGGRSGGDENSKGEEEREDK